MSGRIVRRPEDLGGMGESFFSLLAKDAGMVANASTDDKAGWDFEVEVPSPLVVDYKDQSRAVYRVQVKSTMSESLSVAMTYSSLLSLIQYGGPAFVFFIQYGSDLMPRAIFLEHIDESRSLEILKAIREKEESNHKLKLNKAKMSFKVRSVPFSLPFVGRELLDRFSLSVRDGYLKYLEGKAKWLQSLERESKLWKSQMSISGRSNFEAMINCMLGYEAEFNASAVMYKAPLGVRAEKTAYATDLISTTLSPVKEDLPRALVRLRTSQYGAAYEFKAVLFSVSDVFPREFHAVRVHTDLFDIVCRFESGEIKFDVVDFDVELLPVSVSELRGFLRYIDEANQSGSTFFEIQMCSGGEPLKLKVGTQGAIKGNYDLVCSVIEGLYIRLSALGLASERINAGRIFERAEELGFFVHVGEVYKPVYSFEFMIDEFEAAKERADVVVFTYRLELQDKVVVFFSAFYGDILALGGGRYKGCFGRSEYLGEIIVPRGEKVDFEALIKECAAIYEERLQSEGILVL